MAPAMAATMIAKGFAGRSSGPQTAHRLLVARIDEKLEPTQPFESDDLPARSASAAARAPDADRQNRFPPRPTT